MDHIQSLIASFKNQLSSAFEEYEQSRSSRPRVSMAGGVRSRHRVKNGMKPLVRTKLSQLVNLVSDISQDMSTTTQSISPLLDNEDQEDVLDATPVCLKGPPGAEPRSNLPTIGKETDTYSREEESFVHQRNSTNIALSPFLSPRKLKQVRMKDGPPSKCEIFVEPPKEVCSALRYTRSRERACSSGGSLGRVCYREESDDSYDSSSEEEEEFSPAACSDLEGHSSADEFSMVSGRVPKKDLLVTSTPASVSTRHGEMSSKIEHDDLSRISTGHTSSVGLPQDLTSYPDQESSMSEGMDTSSSLYQSALEELEPEKNKDKLSRAKPSDSPASKRSTTSPTASSNSKVSRPISPQSPSSPIAYNTPSPLLSPTLGRGDPNNHSFKSVEETPPSSTSSSKNPDSREVGEPAVEHGVGGSSSSLSLQHQVEESSLVDSKETALYPTPPPLIQDNLIPSSPLNSGSCRSRESPLSLNSSLSVPQTSESKPSSSSLQRVLDDLHRSFSSKQPKKAKRPPTVKRELRSNSRRVNSSNPQPTVLPLPFRHKAVVVVEKLSLNSVKPRIEQQIKKEKVELSRQDSGESKSWKEYEEEVLSSSADPMEESSSPLLSSASFCGISEPLEGLSSPPRGASSGGTEEVGNWLLGSACEAFEESGVEETKDEVVDSDGSSDEESPNFLAGPSRPKSRTASSKLSLKSRSRSHSVASSWEDLDMPRFTKKLKNTPSLNPNPQVSASPMDRKPSTPTTPVNRKASMSTPLDVITLSNSEDDFDMTCSRPPNFLKSTPKRRTQPITASSVKRKKILRSFSDDEDVGPMDTSVKKEPSSPVDETEGSHSNRHTQNIVQTKADSTTRNGGSSESSGSPSVAKDLPPENTRTAKLPMSLPCASCGIKYRTWRRIFSKHPRIDILVCKECMRLITSGEFTVSDGHEEYCSLCGDGGEILMCSSCIRSICIRCIRRVSGENFLRNLIENEDEELTCYCCDPSPIADLQQLYKDCHQLRYGSCASGKNKSAKSGSKPDSTAASSGKSKSKSVKKEQSSSRTEQSSSRTEQSSSRIETNSRRSNVFVSKRRDRSSSESSNSVFTVDSSNEDSPEVNTDDVSLSDSSVFDEAAQKVGRKRRELKRCRESSSSASSDQSDDRDKNRSKYSGKKSPWLRRLPSDDFEYESSSTGSTKNNKSGLSKDSTAKLGKKRSLSTSSSESLNTSRTTKRSKLAVMLSSASESDTRSKLTETIEDPSEDNFLFLPSTPDNKSFRPLTYLTPRSKNIGSDSSDSDVQIVSQKPKKKRKLKKLTSTSSQSGDSSGTETRAKAESSRGHGGSGDDFTDLSRVGPRLKKKTVRKLMLSDVSDSDTSTEAAKSENNDGDGEAKSPEKQTTPGKKRRAIRKVLDESKLDEKTKLAVRREKERLNRLKKRKTSGVSEGEKLILEVDNESKEALVAVRSSITPSIKPHQKEGIKFLYEACVESLKRFKSGQRNGAILAHCMGLGKTLQLLAFVDALLNCEDSGVKRVLILTPVNTLYNWRNELERWIPTYNYGVYLMNVKGIMNRVKKLKRWHHYGGIMFIGYDMFRNLAKCKAKNCRKKTREDLAKCLLDPGADIIVCDEGHVMRNSKSGLSLILGQVKTTCRIVLTGTPLQNNLLEYYTMVNFVKPNLLGTQKEFKNQFVNPIKNGQCSDSKPSDIRTMKHRAHVLHHMLEGCVQRRDFRVLSEALPPKHEFVISFHLTEVQDKLYRFYLEEFRCNGAKDLFSTFSNLAKVWNHPWVLRLSEERQRLNAESDEEEESSLDGFIVYSSDEEFSRKKKKRKRKRKKGPGSSASSISSHSRTGSIEPIVISSDDDEVCINGASIPQPVLKSEPGVAVSAPNGVAALASDQPGPSGLNKSSEPEKSSYWYDSLLTEDVQTKLEASGKLVFLMELLDRADLLREKVIVFSQSLLTLDMIERFLGDHGDWTPGLDYYRLDGSTSADVRQSNMTEFNDTSNDRIRLFLISTRAGSLGVNLVAANRVVIFDACWNPSHDLQAIFRTYRFGQTKPVFVYRLLAQGTMEEKIYDRQVTKESLSLRVVDSKQIGRHYTASDLAELFTYSPKPPAQPPYKRPKDDWTLCSILDKLEPQYISGYHEHDSLLEHIYDEELSEEEKKAAWEEYKQQTSVEAQRYNYESLHNRLAEAQQELAGPSARPDPYIINGPESLLRARVPPLIPSAYRDALNFLDASISKCEVIIKNQKTRANALSKLEVGQMSREDVIQVVSTVTVTNDRIRKELAYLLTLTNQSIIRFNGSPESQIPDINRKVSEKRARLQALHIQATRVLPVPAYNRVLQSMSVTHPGSSSSASLTRSDTGVSSTTR